jgi:hypothetical protein
VPVTCPAGVTPQRQLNKGTVAGGRVGVGTTLVVVVGAGGATVGATEVVVVGAGATGVAEVSVGADAVPELFTALTAKK